MKNYELDLRDIFEYVKNKQLSSEEGFKIIKLLDNEHKSLKQYESSKIIETHTNYKFFENKESTDYFTLNDIAVIGISCRFADACNTDELWNNLSLGIDSINEIASDRWNDYNLSSLDFQNIHKSDYRWGGFISGIDLFDPLFFNISPREAEIMDPQQRLFLQHAWKSIEDAGYCPDDLQKTACGIFIGGNTSDYNLRFTENEYFDPYLITGNTSSILASRISYFLDLKGPSITVDTACSSSLVAAHLACESIRTGTCEIAIAGGVMTMPTPNIYINFDKAGMISPTRRCKTFDQNADGFVPGEGIGAILLKPLIKAIEDNDHIYGVIKGSEINQDGKTNGITAPSALSQQELECNVYEKYNLSPESITYIETHGTGTKLGDPIEIQALTNAFRKYTTKNNFCAVGSIKTNIGHTLASAGIAGLIKVLLCLYHKKIPASLNFRNANEYIKFEHSPFYVNTQLCSWIQKSDLPRRAAVSSFGFSGTNCHMIVEEAPTRNHIYSSIDRPYYLIPISARNESTLNRQIKSFSDQLSKSLNNFELGDVAYTLFSGRRHFSVRCALVVKNMEDLKGKLHTLTSGEKFDGFLINHLNGHKTTEEPSLKEFGNHLIKELNGLTISSDSYRQKLIVLADLYTKGYNLTWNFLYNKNDSLRIPLPTYPFAEERFWLSSNQDAYLNKSHHRKNTNFKKLHPLVGTNTSNLNETCFTTCFNGNEFFISQHIINGDKILPGVAFIEMIRAAGQLATANQVNFINDLTWLRPIVIKNGKKNISIELYPSLDTDKIQVEISSVNRKGRKLLHAQGSIYYSHSIKENDRPVDIKQIINRCDKKFNGNTCYEKYHEIGLSLGSCFRVLKNIYVNSKEILAKLIMPKDLENDFDKFMLHPAIMDGCLQSAIGFSLMNKKDPILYVPFALNEVKILNSLPNICYAHLKLVSKEEHINTDNKILDASILDENGCLLLKMQNINARPYQPNLSRTKTIKNADEQKFENIYYKSVWIKNKIINIAHELNYLEGSFLIIDEKKDLFFAITELLNANFSSEKSPHVFLVQPGSSFKRIDQSTFELNFHSIEDYTKLFQAINFTDSQFFYLVQNLCKPVLPDLDHILNRSHHVDYLNNGIFTLFHLTQALLFHDTPFQKQYKLFILYTGTKNGPLPEYAALNGFAKSLVLENSKFLFKTIELKCDDDNSSIMPSTQIADIIINELGSSFAEGNEIRYYQNRRWVHFWKKINLTKHSFDIFPFKENGVYLITGGFGAIGSKLSRHIATNLKTNLILTGRSDLDQKKEIKLKQLNSTGSNAIYIKADLFNNDDVNQLLQKAKSSFGSINGIFHIAGITKDALIQNKKYSDFRDVLNPKMAGTLNLDIATINEPLDFFVLFSSFSSITGNLGQSDYSSANCYLNHYVNIRENLRKLKKRSGITFSIIWPLWKDGGLKVNKETETFFEDYYGAKALNAQTGLKILDEILLSNIRMILVAQLDISKNPTKSFFSIKRKNNLIDKSSSHIIAPENDRKLFNKFKNDLFKIIARLTKIKSDHIDLNKNLTSYGFDSISFGEFSVLLNKKFNIFISPAKFFEFPTIDAFSQHIFHEHFDTILLFYQKKTNSHIPSNRNINLIQIPDYKINKSYYKIKKSNHNSRNKIIKEDPIAIIGMCGVMPRSDDLESFWENLVTGKNLITQVPEKRFTWGSFKEVLARENESDLLFKGGFISDIDTFDASFFNISPHEAELMDPQQRILLEIVWKTIEDAGYRASDLSGSNTGLFVGVSSSDYADIVSKNVNKIESHFATGLSHSVLANRISYFFNLHGPSAPIDTACSSSLIALHRACQEIQNYNCDMAIAGGVNVLLNPDVFISFKKAGMLSNDGKCKAFDQSADGYVRGEGAGAVLLKPLKRAINDLNHIYAVIKASGVNHGGHAISLTAPNMIAQSDLLIDIYKKANIDPSTISYIEAHGTGTSLGDPIEVDGLKRAFSAFPRVHKQPHKEQKYCGIGSVKSNTGHLEAAAGIASLFKVLLAIKHKKIPPNLNFNKLNSYIDLNGSPFYIVTDTQDWVQLNDLEKNPLPRRAGISSFGFGGSNAHILLEEYNLNNSLYNPTLLNPQIFLFSAKTEKSLSAYIHKMITFLAKFKNMEESVNFNDISCNQREIETTSIKFNEIAYTLQVGREFFNKRLAIIASNFDELFEHLSQYLQHNIDDEFIFYGNFKEKQILADLLMEENEGKEFLRNIIRRKKLEKLSKLWVSGIAIDWSLLYDGQLPRRISLPTYAFNRTRYWYNTNKNHQNYDIPGNNECLSKEIDSDSVYDALISLKPDSRRDFLISYLTQNVTDLLKIGPEQQLNSKVALVSIGMDSLMALKLKQHIETALCIDMSVINLLGDENIENIASQILYHLENENSNSTSEDQTSYHESHHNNFIEGVL